MDFFEKLNELHANSVSPEKIKEVSGVSKDEMLQKVMDFVDKFDAKQKEPEKGEKETVIGLQRVAATPHESRYAARINRVGLAARAGMVGKNKRVGGVTFTFKKTKKGLIVVDKLGKKACFALRPDQMAGIDVKNLLKGISVGGVKLANAERPKGSHVRRKLKNGPKGGPEE